MRDEKLRLRTRLLIGGIAGFVGTMAMTGAMRRLHRRLPKSERYPLPPREIVDSAAKQLRVPLAGETAKDIGTAAHFAYGAAMGALIAAANPDPKKRTGAAAGAAVWLASYMGWIPAVGNLQPATRHPARRNALMIAAHLVWGTATAAAIRELRLARETILEDGPDKDAPKSSPSSLGEGDQAKPGGGAKRSPEYPLHHAAPRRGPPPRASSGRS
ncbi:MAG TPA: hypothetical protein VGD66_11645 [Allosphingosinicella sp.]|jgi:uncharacterized membrane protein YagU involved in acid resistance